MQNGFDVINDHTLMGFLDFKKFFIQEKKKGVFFFSSPTEFDNQCLYFVLYRLAPTSVLESCVCSQQSAILIGFYPSMNCPFPPQKYSTILLILSH